MNSRTVKFSYSAVVLVLLLGVRSYRLLPKYPFTIVSSTEAARAWAARGLPTSSASRAARAKGMYGATEGDSQASSDPRQSAEMAFHLRPRISRRALVEAASISASAMAVLGMP